MLAKCTNLGYLSTYIQHEYETRNDIVDNTNVNTCHLYTPKTARNVCTISSIGSLASKPQNDETLLSLILASFKQQGDRIPLICVSCVVVRKTLWHYYHCARERGKQTMPKLVTLNGVIIADTRYLCSR